MVLKSNEEYALAKQKNSRFGDIWRNFYSGKNKVGPCIALCCKYRPQSYQEFMDKYIMDAIENKDAPLSKRGRTIEELKEICVNPYYEHVCKKYPDKHFDYDTFFDEVICHVIIETFDGRKREREMANHCVGKGYEIEYPSNEDDSKYGIDFFCNKEGNKMFIIQTKPLSFFTSKRNDTILDRINAFIKATNAIKKYNIPYYFTIYDSKEDKWCRNIKRGNSVLYKLSDLYQEDGSFRVSEMKELTGTTAVLT